MMDNKLSEMSKPVATVDVQRGRPDGNMFGVAWSSAGHAIPDGPHFLYSQEYVSALLAELEAKAMECRGIKQERELFRIERAAHQQHAQELEKRVAELEAIATDYAGKFQKAQDANKHLIIMSNDDKRRIAELEERLKLVREQRDNELRSNAILEKRLATPVRLPVVLMGYQSDDYRIGFMEGVEKSGEEVRAAGFTVEGDE